MLHDFSATFVQNPNLLSNHLAKGLPHQLHVTVILVIRSLQNITATCTGLVHVTDLSLSVC